MILQSKAAVVTGSTSGIGLAIAKALAREGANVMINGLGDAGQIEATRADIEAEFGVRVLYSGADMTRPPEIAAMVAEAEGAFGRVDVLVNNAGIQYVSPVEEFPPEKWDADLASSSEEIVKAEKHEDHKGPVNMKALQEKTVQTLVEKETKLKEAKPSHENQQ